MSSGNINILARFGKLLSSVAKLLHDNKRDLWLILSRISDVLQVIVDGDCKPDVVLGKDIWARVYVELGMSVEYGQFILAHHGFPEDQNHLWVVPVLRGVTCNKVVAALRCVLRKAGYDLRTYVEDLDASVPTNDRDPNNGSYFVGFAKNVEADEGNKSKSANALAAEKHKGITLLERLLLEFGYFLATGEFLDVKNVTLCTGSRSSSGSVPGVHCLYYREVYVRCYSSDSAHECLRSRSVRFHAPKPANAG